MNIIKYTYEAKINLSEIQSYIFQDSPYHSIEVLNSIKYTINFLKDIPYMWIQINWNLRKIIEVKYKYSIFYKIYEDDKIIEIISISKYKNI
jgi:hypothetical protein